MQIFEYCIQMFYVLENNCLRPARLFLPNIQLSCDITIFNFQIYIALYVNPY